jgi:hypothetical protein
MIAVFERAKTVHVFDRAATVIGPVITDFVNEVTHATET